MITFWIALGNDFRGLWTLSWAANSVWGANLVPLRTSFDVLVPLRAGQDGTQPPPRPCQESSGDRFWKDFGPNLVDYCSILFRFWLALVVFVVDLLINLLACWPLVANIC